MVRWLQCGALLLLASRATAQAQQTTQKQAAAVVPQPTRGVEVPVIAGVSASRNPNLAIEYVTPDYLEDPPPQQQQQQQVLGGSPRAPQADHNFVEAMMVHDLRHEQRQVAQDESFLQLNMRTDAYDEHPNAFKFARDSRAQSPSDYPPYPYSYPYPYYPYPNAYFPFPSGGFGGEQDARQEAQTQADIDPVLLQTQSRHKQHVPRYGLGYGYNPYSYGRGYSYYAPEQRPYERLDSRYPPPPPMMPVWLPQPPWVGPKTSAVSAGGAAPAPAPS
jgi:hypothetical protein